MSPVAHQGSHVRLKVFGFRAYLEVMGSYKWGYKSPNKGYNITIVTLIITPRITTHEPPSRVWELEFRI